MWIGAGILLLYVLLRLPSWSTDGLRKDSKSTATGNALLELQGLLEPRKRHVAEIRREARKVEADQSGSPVP